jgi:sulfate permease, SulP family
LSKGVLAGVILSALFFAAKISKVEIESTVDEAQNHKTYIVKGQLFFASVTDFVSHFNFNEKADLVIIDLSQSHLWDDSAVGAIDKVVMKYRQNNVKVEIAGLNEDSSVLVKKLAVHDKANAKMAAQSSS